MNTNTLYRENSNIKAFTDYHLKVKGTFSKLPEKGKLGEIIKRIGRIVFAVLLYPLLGLRKGYGILQAKRQFKELKGVQEKIKKVFDKTPGDIQLIDINGISPISIESLVSPSHKTKNDKLLNNTDFLKKVLNNFKKENQTGLSILSTNEITYQYRIEKKTTSLLNNNEINYKNDILLLIKLLKQNGKYSAKIEYENDNRDIVQISANSYFAGYNSKKDSYTFEGERDALIEKIKENHLRPSWVINKSNLGLFSQKITSGEIARPSGNKCTFTIDDKGFERTWSKETQITA